MPFHRRMGGMINSIKHIVEGSTVLAASTNAVLSELVSGNSTYVLSTANGVPAGAKVHSIFLSVYFIAEGGEIAAEVPLVDWYLILNRGDTFGTTFDSTNLPTPGNTGVHVNKNKIIHTEKGLAGGGDASLAGVPMIFKGVIKFPRGMQRVAVGDRWMLCARANFNTKICFQAIYKHFT